MNISGGAFGRDFNVSSGGALNLFGGEFRLDDVLLVGLDTVRNSISVSVPYGSVLSGTLADGRAFALSPNDSDYLAEAITLNAAALPPVNPAVVVLPGSPELQESEQVKRSWSTMAG